MRRRIGTVVGAALFIGATCSPRRSRRTTTTGGRATVITSGLRRRRASRCFRGNSIVVGAGRIRAPGRPALEYVFRGEHKGTFPTIPTRVSVVDGAVTPDGAIGPSARTRCCIARVRTASSSRS